MGRRRRGVQTRGLVLRWVPYSNTSQVVTLFTRDLGVVSALAKGSSRGPRKSSSFAQPLDTAGWYDVVLSERGGDLDLITEARLVEGFDHLRSSLPAHLEACFALEVLARTFAPRDPNPQILRGALSFLKLLAVEDGQLALRVHFAHQVLTELGVRPEWGSVPLVLRPTVGIIADSEARLAPDPADVPIARETVEYLAWESTLVWGAVPSVRAPRAVVRRAWDILRALLLFHLERPPRSLRHLETTI